MTRERIKDFKEIILPFFTIYFLKENYEGLGKSDAEEFEKDFNEILNLAAKALEQQSCEDAISRQAAIDEIKSHYRVDNDLLEVIAYKIGKLPSVQPKYNPDEWCHDCKEYNHDKHCCPRFNRVIRNTVEEMKQEQESCDKCEVGNPCLYCKHEFEPQESEETDERG